MARMTADDMISFARLGLGGETTETITNNQILRLVNQSYMEIASKYEFPELEETASVSVSSGTAEYDIGVADILTIISCVDSTNGLRLERIDRHQYNRFTQGTTTAPGNPVYWFITGTATSGNKNVTFFPTPDSSLTAVFYYRERPAELVISPGTATSPILPEPWDDSIVQRAIARGWKLLGDTKRARDFSKLAEENDMSAAAISMKPSEVPTYYGSIVGSAWNG